MVYLIHFSRIISPKHTTQHYCGKCEDGRLAERLQEHQTGQGARLCQVAAERGIGIDVVRVWPGKGRVFEKQLKNAKNLPRLCPVCNPDGFSKRR